MQRAASSPAYHPWSEGEIAAIVGARLGGAAPGFGLIVAVVDRTGRRVVCGGDAGRPDGAPLDGDTLFEIGSSTKAFTGLLLAEMAARGEVSLDDPIDRFLPAEVQLLTPEGGGITLAALASHTSGLPHDADNHAPRDPANPFAGYTAPRLYDFLRRWRPPLGHPVYAYSNVGMGLLGHALARRAGVDFEALVRERITDPLGMTSTAIKLTPDKIGRFTRGHDYDGRPTVHMDLPVIEGAGALISTAKDLATFLEAELGFTETPLAAAMAAQLAPRWPTGRADFQVQALGWAVTTATSGEVAWHVGRTGGFRSFLGFHRERGVGAIVLGNQATAWAGDDIGFHLLVGRPMRPITSRPAGAVSPQAMEAYGGRYRLSSSLEIVVTRETGRLIFSSGGRRHVLYPENATTFFMKQFDVQATFERDAAGRATALLLRENGRTRRAPRIAASRLEL